MAIALLGPLAGAGAAYVVTRRELVRFQAGVLEAVQVAVRQQDERIRKAKSRDTAGTDPGQISAKVNEERQVQALMLGQSVGEEWLG